MNLPPLFTVIEAGAVVVVLWEILWGLKRRLSGELFRLLATAIGLGAGLRLYQAGAGVLARHTRLSESPDIAEALAFLLIILLAAAVFLLLRLLGRLLLTVKFNESVDRPAGALAGLLRAGLLIGMWVWALGLWPYPPLRTLVRSDSVIGRAVFRAIPPLVERLQAVRIEPPPVVPAQGLRPAAPADDPAATEPPN